MVIFASCWVDETVAHVGLDGIQAIPSWPDLRSIPLKIGSACLSAYIRRW